MSDRDIALICAEGEGQKIEFAAKASGLAKEMVAFANASGGSIFLGIADSGEITGVADTPSSSEISELAIVLRI